MPLICSIKSFDAVTMTDCVRGSDTATTCDCFCARLF